MSSASLDLNFAVVVATDLLPSNLTTMDSLEVAAYIYICIGFGSAALGLDMAVAVATYLRASSLRALGLMAMVASDPEIAAKWICRLCPWRWLQH